jgi:hypothetical protein
MHGVDGVTLGQIGCDDLPEGFEIIVFATGETGFTGSVHGSCSLLLVRQPDTLINDSQHVAAVEGRAGQEQGVTILLGRAVMIEGGDGAASFWQVSTAAQTKSTRHRQECLCHLVLLVAQTFLSVLLTQPRSPGFDEAKLFLSGRRLLPRKVVRG